MQLYDKSRVIWDVRGVAARVILGKSIMILRQFTQCWINSKELTCLCFLHEFKTQLILKILLERNIKSL